MRLKRAGLNVCLSLLLGITAAGCSRDNAVTSPPSVGPKRTELSPDDSSGKGNLTEAEWSAVMTSPDAALISADVAASSAGGSTTDVTKPAIRVGAFVEIDKIRNIATGGGFTYVVSGFDAFKEVRVSATITRKNPDIDQFPLTSIRYDVGKYDARAAETYSGDDGVDCAWGSFWVNSDTWHLGSLIVPGLPALTDNRSAGGECVGTSPGGDNWGGSGGGGYNGSGDQEGGTGETDRCKWYWDYGVPCPYETGGETGGGSGDGEGGGDTGGGDTGGGEVGPTDPCSGKWSYDLACSDWWYSLKANPGGGHLSLAAWSRASMRVGTKPDFAPYLVAVASQPLPNRVASLIGRFPTARGSRDVIYLSPNFTVRDWSAAVQTLEQDRKRSAVSTSPRVLRVYTSGHRSLEVGGVRKNLASARSEHGRALRQFTGLARAHRSLRAALDAQESKPGTPFGSIRLLRWPMGGSPPLRTTSGQSASARRPWWT